VFALILVLVHIGALFVESADDTLFAMSPDGPTRARMALMATVALLVVVALGAGRRRLPLSGAAWRILHAYFALLVIVLGFGHALLTDGALDGAGTVAMLAFAAVGITAIPAAFAARTRRARRS
jgi:DMSO/TMAO reductase YedYZ heme-binding membrane subunit